MSARGLRPHDFRTAQDLELLPIIDKATVQADLSSFRSEAVGQSSCLEMHSAKGGTTYWDKTAILRRLAIAERERAVWLRLAGNRFNQRQLHIMTQGGTSLKLRAFWDKSFLVPPWICRKFYADPFLSYEEIIGHLDAIRPQIVFSYGSFAEHFFHYLLDAGHTPHLPSVWYYGADALPRDARQFIEEKFAVKIYSVYAASETGRIGFECENRNGFHLNTDTVIVRLVDKAGNNVIPGEVGEVTVSCLTNRAMVLLNYRLGDLAEMQTEDCSCGRNLPVLRELHGRVFDSIQLADGTYITSAAFLGRFNSTFRKILKAQAVSLGPGRMCWRIVPGRNCDRTAFTREVMELSERVFHGAIRVTMDFVDEIPSAASGKFKAVEPCSATVAGDQENGRRN